MARALEITDVQTLILTGHGDLTHGCALWITGVECAGASRTLRELVDRDVRFGSHPGTTEPRVQLLLSAAGMVFLGVPEATLLELHRPFAEGMVTLPRSGALGDSGRNDPLKWHWKDEDIHILVLVYAADAGAATAEARRVMDNLDPEWKLIRQLAIYLPSDSRELFGFRDGLSNPRINWRGTATAPGEDRLPPGEIVPGYLDAAGVETAAHSLARNGTFVAIRQLQQDVQGFWRFWTEQTRDEDEAVWAASKAFGRYPNGMPTVAGAPGPQPTLNDVVARAPLTFVSDPRGTALPLGSHVRRANPRDGLNESPEVSRAIVALHRMIRRGRVYGAPAAADWYPAAARPRDAVETKAEDSERGLLFMCLCADLMRQFEFIQQSWFNHPKHADLYDEIDPIVGGDGISGDGRHFSIPRERVRRRISTPANWVTVRGGGYFLLPGKTVLESITQ